MSFILNYVLSLIFVAIAVWIYFWNQNSGEILEIAQKAETKYPEKFQEWKDRCEKLYKLNNIPLPLRVEASNKIGKNNQNTHRYSVYVPKILKTNIDKALLLMNVPKSHLKEIGDDIKEHNQEIIYGVDLSSECGRIYLNRSSEEVLAWEWINDVKNQVAQKKYLVVTHDIATDMLKMFPKKIVDIFESILPNKQWEHCCVKYDTRERKDIPCAMYFSPMYAPSLEQIFPKLSLLIKEINPQASLDSWFHQYKSCSVSWYVLTNKKENIQISVYFNTAGRIADFVERRMFSIYN